MAHTTSSSAPIQAFTSGRTHVGPILAAVGGSDPQGAIRAAMELASSSRSGVLALSVVEPLPAYLGGEPMGAYMPPGYEDERKVAELERLGATILETIGTQSQWSLQVAQGDAAHVIAQIAFEQRSPLIITGLGRHRRIDRFLGLETTLRTVHRARCPVLAVGKEFARPRNIVIATDFTPQSARAAEIALPLLDSAATVTLLHVWQRSAAAEADASLADEDARHAEGLQRRFDRLANALPTLSGMQVKYATREGEPIEQILAFATEQGADLLVAGRRGLGTMQRLLAHSVTAGLLRGAGCAVLIAPEPQYADIDRLTRWLTGTSESMHPSEWSVQLDNFSRRNHGRTAAIEVDDASLGAQLQASGYPFLGATYDQHDHRVQLMIGSSAGDATHLVRSIADVWSVAIVADAHGHDLGLRIAHGDGQTLLTFGERL